MASFDIIAPRDTGGVLVATCGKCQTEDSECSANAHLIVTAVNERDSLLAENKRLREALEEVYNGYLGCEGPSDRSFDWVVWAEKARAVLADKEGK